MTRALIAFALGGAAILSAALPARGAAPEPTTVEVPWRAGNAETFRAGSPEEGGRHSAVGALPVTIHRPAVEGRAPFVVLLHGCGGLGHDAMWAQWVEPWVDLLAQHGVGAAVVDSYTPRGVSQVCTRNPGAWAVRRADDAYSVRAWLEEQSYVDHGHVAVMGMSNGGRTVLAALRTSLRHPTPFVAGIALYPGCQSDVDGTFYAPLLVLIGRADTVTPARHCEEMKRHQPATAPELTLVVYPRAPHTFDMPLPDRRILGMRLGFDAEALADARRQVVTFLTAHGVMPPAPAQ
jgi:dienelactone hydrolase